MTKILLFYSLLTTAIIALVGTPLLRENSRLRQNQDALTERVAHYRTKADEAAASVRVLRLRCGEFEQARVADAERIERLGVRLRRLEAVAKTATTTDVAMRAVLRDTVVVRDTVYRPVLSWRTERGLTLDTIPVRDTVGRFRWSDGWVSVEGRIADGVVECSVHSVDTLRQVVHRVPRRLLGIPCGVKCLRQEVVSSNPHTQIVYSEYIMIERRRRR